LVVYHLMFAPEHERACKNCSFWAAHFGGIEAHLKQRHTTRAAISRAPPPKLQHMAKQLGWTFKWVSCGENGFNHDFGTSFTSCRGGCAPVDRACRGAERGSPPVVPPLRGIESRFPWKPEAARRNRPSFSGNQRTGV